MTTFPPTSAPVNSPTSQGIAALKSGDKTRAHECLSYALRQNPRDEQAWLWLSGVVASDAERYYCLEQVLTINPGNASAKHGLGLLPRVIPVSPLLVTPDLTPQARPPESRPEPSPASPSTELPEPELTLQAVQDPAYVLPTASTIPELPVVAQGQLLSLPANDTPSTASALAGREADVEFVVRALGGNNGPENVSRMLCEQKGYNWSEAQSFVAEVAAQQKTRIARRQSPFLLFLGVTTIIGGLWLVLSNGSFLLRFATQPVLLNPTILVRGGTLFVVGIGMVLGSLIGIVQQVRAMLR